MKKIIVLILTPILGLGFLLTPHSFAETSTELLLREDVKWEPLNPARGDKSPQAAALWGGLKSNEPTAFLVKFRDGFSSPPHIHNVTYRGVVISGLVHNDDPEAANLWMPMGSFWTQPAGEAHITSAKGENNVAYIEIDQGPYLVEHAEEAFDNGERPINIEERNIVWIDANDISWAEPSGVKISFLWGERSPGEFNGTMIKLPPGFSGQIHSEGEIFRGVIIHGSADYQSKILTPGSYFGSKGEAAHKITSDTEQETIIYVRTNGPIKITSES